MSKEEWYSDGLSFECTQCGNCCTGPPGFVWFDRDELHAMAEYVGMTPKKFQQTYARKIQGQYSLNETLTEHGYDCVFLRRDEEGLSEAALRGARAFCAWTRAG